MNPVTLLGFVAETLTTLAFLPQVVKTWRTKSSNDLSVSTLGMISTGVLLWLVYGLLVGDLPIIAANAVTLVLVVSIFVLALAIGSETFLRRGVRPLQRNKYPYSNVWGCGSMGEKDRSSHPPILPHAHTEKDNYFLGMA